MQRTMRGFKTLLVMLCVTAVAASAMAQQSGTVQNSGAAPKNQTAQADKDRGATKPVEDSVPESAEMAKAREKVQFLLSGFEFFPKREDLDAVAPAPMMTSILKGFVANPETAPTTRFRAVDALGLYSQEDVGAFLLPYANAPGKVADEAELRTLEMMRHRSIIAYAKSQQERANAGLIPMLEDSDLQIRLTAISALGQHGGAEGVKHLRALKAKDTHHAVQRMLNKYVQ